MLLAERNRILAAFDRDLSGLLAAHGFQRRPDSPSRAELFRRWERRTEWRLDRFEMISHDFDVTGPEIQADVQVLLPTGASETMDAGPIRWLLDQQTERVLSYADLERRGSGAAEAELLRAALIECERGIGWFQRFDTPELCLQELTRRDRNGVRSGTPRFVQVVAELERCSQHLG